MITKITPSNSQKGSARKKKITDLSWSCEKDTVYSIIVPHIDENGRTIRDTCSSKRRFNYDTVGDK